MRITPRSHRVLFLLLLLSAAIFALVPRPEQELPQLSEKSHLWLSSLPPASVSQNLADVPRIFKKIKKISKELVRPAIVAQRPENKDKNAHITILPFDETRTLREKPGFYINANDISTPRQRYIAAQCPALADVADFWRAVLETETPTILALLMPHDAHGRHCPYWTEKTLPLSIDGWSLSLADNKETLAESTTEPDQRIIRRTVLASKSGASRRICHLHYENWPDFGAPAPDLFSALLELVDRIHPSADLPLLVHCAAGVGRTGTFIAAHSLRKDILAGVRAVCIPRRILELRHQRPKMVSSTKQCEAIYRAVLSSLSSPPPEIAPAQEEEGGSSQDQGSRPESKTLQQDL